MFPSPAATRTIQRDCNKESTMISESATILIVEDEQDIRELLAYNLEKEGYATVQAADGKEGLELARSRKPDLILLDLMLPKMDGLAVCRELERDSGTVRIPIIMLTAKGDDMDKILGLEYGADDYITKPFNILEVKARIRAIIRRSSSKTAKEPEKVLSFESLRIDLDSRRGYIDDKEVNLTAKEFDLLELLMLHPNKVYSREELLNTVWGYDYPGDARTVDVHIRRLREKIEQNPSEPKYVHTKWGVGYYFQG